MDRSSIIILNSGLHVIYLQPTKEVMGSFKSIFFHET
jgi:hypothetical protein